MAEYLKIPEVAHRLDVSEKTARRYVKSGTLPSVFIGGAYRVSAEDLEDFLRSARVKPGKAQASPSLEPTFNDVLAEERRATTEGYNLGSTARPHYIESVEPVGRPILALLDFPTTQMKEWGRGQRDYVSSLPKDLPFEEVIAHLQRMRMFLYWYRLLTWQLSREDFSTVVYPWYERQAAGAPVPEDIQQAIRDFEAAWNELEAEAVPLTLEWVDRERHRNAANTQVARLSADMDQLLEEQRASARDLLIRK